jgi:hypothetical protein
MMVSVESQRKSDEMEEGGEGMERRVREKKKEGWKVVHTLSEVMSPVNPGSNSTSLSNCLWHMTFTFAVFHLLSARLPCPLLHGRAW